MDFSISCQIHQLGHAILCINCFLPCQLHIFFNKQFYISKIQRGNETCQFMCRCLSCYNKSKSETVLLNLTPTNFSLRLVSCLVGHDKMGMSLSYRNIFQCHNQYSRGQYSPNCMQVVLCANKVINTIMKSIHHSRL